ncbi:hypothetical protein [Moraxella bovis]|uniref:Uncharacterized protein n=1 Tax=Moraxella bovis TaxID=476 RepID=A0A378Q4H4_MORBO|nr:hypothetical protein [Moraxella bovis]STY94077.1 Uncharacterised protein [Moraxella bovis]
MKNKLRKIVIDDDVYLYKVTRNARFDYMQICVFLNGYKVTPLIINFYHQWDVTGFLLSNGISLFNHFTNTNQMVNLNEPKYIRQFILLGKQNGWTGKNKIPIQDGAIYLNTLGFDVSFMNTIPK